MKRNIRKDEGEFNFWQPATDMMTGLVFILMLIVALLCLYILGDYSGYEDQYSSSVASHIDDYEGWGWGWGWSWDHDDGGGGDGDGDGRYDEIPVISAGGGSYGDEGIKSAVFVELVDAETNRAILEDGVSFELYRTDQTLLRNASRQTLYTYYPEKIAFDDFETTEEGTFYLPEKIVQGNYYFHELTEPKGYDAAQDTYFDITELYDWPDPYVVQVRVTPSKNIIRVQMTDQDTGLPVGGGTFRVIAAEDVTTLDGTVRYRSGQVVSTITCDSEGYGESEELYLGNYRVEQLGVPEYYASLTESLEVAVEKKDSSGAPIHEVTTERSRIVVSLTDELYNTQKLSNVKFLVTNDGTGETQTLLTDTLGNITLDQLDKNTSYRIQQLEPTGNYLQDTTEYTVNVSSTGRFNGEATTSVNLTNRLLRVAINVVDTISRNDVDEVTLSLYDSDENLVRTWLSNGGAQTFTDLKEGTYYLLRGEEGSAKRYEFRVENVADVQEWTISMFTVKSLVALGIGLLVVGAVVLLLLFLLRILLRYRKVRRENKAARQAALAAGNGAESEAEDESETDEGSEQ